MSRQLEGRTAGRPVGIRAARDSPVTRAPRLGSHAMQHRDPPRRLRHRGELAGGTIRAEPPAASSAGQPTFQTQRPGETWFAQRKVPPTRSVSGLPSCAQASLALQQYGRRTFDETGSTDQYEAMAEGQNRSRRARWNDRLWPGLRVRAVLLVCGCAIVATHFLLMDAGYDNVVVKAFAPVGLILAMLQFTLSDEGIG